MVRKVVPIRSSEFQDAITGIHPQKMTYDQKNQNAKYFKDGKVVLSNRDSVLSRIKKKGK